MKKIVVLFIIVALIAVFAGCVNFGTYNYADAEQYTAGGGELNAEGISKLNLNWISGDVIFESYDGEDILLSEEYSGELKESDLMRYRVNNDTLDVRFFAPRSSVRFSLNTNLSRKKLIVKVPNTLELIEVKVSVVSADSAITNISADELNINTVSGKIDISGSYTNKLDINTVSGRINFEGSANDCNIKGVSGRLNLDYNTMPAIINVNSVSGNIELKMPENDGFDLVRKSVSGSFTSDFALLGSNTNGTYKDGGASIDVDSVSGNLKLTKKN